MTNPSWTERSVYPFPSILSCKIRLALKQSVAAHRFLNKICFNEGYLSGPKVCRSNLETPCIDFTNSETSWFLKLSMMCVCSNANPLHLRASGSAQGA